MKQDPGCRDYLIVCASSRCGTMLFMDEQVGGLCGACLKRRPQKELDATLERLLIDAGLYVRPAWERPLPKHRPPKATQSSTLF